VSQSKEAATSEIGTTRKSSYVQAKSAMHPIADISSWEKQLTSQTAPCYALQATHISRLRPLGALNP
jgi:hypothetical protein